MARYDVTRFRASHNSYSGHERGSLERQLNAGVRCLEFDFHDNAFAEIGDYTIGHLKPGAEVDHTPPNPPDSSLGSWLRAVAAWSTAHAGHEPITIVLDAKDDLTDNTAGDLRDLNDRLKEIFGGRLFTRQELDQLGGWPESHNLRDRVLCVLSGNGGTRAAYRWAMGSTPALAANAGGDIVLAYRSTAGDINCWTGRATEGDESIEWLRKNPLAASDIDLAQPAIRINDAGWVVAVYRFGPRAQPRHGLMLASKLGKLQEDGRIKWHDFQQLGDGTSPSLRMDGNDIELVFGATSGNTRQVRTGVVEGRKIKWHNARSSTRQPFRTETAAWGARTVAASVDSRGAIHCAINAFVPRPARFQQLVFVERQKGEDPAIFRDAPFFGAGAANRDDVAKARAEGLVARAWGFAELDKTAAPGSPQENFPATDTPLDDWYQEYV